MTDLRTTRLSLHAVAELLLAGPQYAASGTIRLRATPGGFGTVAAPALRVADTALVTGDRSVPLHGRTIAEVGSAAGVTPRAPAEVYAEGSGLPAGHRLSVDDEAAADIAAAFAAADTALAAFEPAAERVLWPEHFDLAITWDEVNYGVSPGDSYLEAPYAYVGPWAPVEHPGAFWNAPFGAARPLAELDDLVGFFVDGRALVAGGTGGPVL